MTAAGMGRTSGERPWRVLTAVFVLYALVLQAVLGGAATLPAAASPFDVICMKQAGDGTAPVQPADHAHHHPGCCTLAPLTAAIAPPAISAPVAWPLCIVTDVTWRMAGAPTARAPPGSIAHPRGPPVV